MVTVVNISIFTAAATAFSALVDRLPPDRWDGPGLDSWDLRALTGHTSRALVTVSTYLGRPALTEAFTTPEAYFAAIAAASTGTAVDASAVTERGRLAGEALGDDPAASVRTMVADALSALDRPDDPLIETIGGGMRLSAYLPTRVFELAVHSLDIVAATGVDFSLPDDVVADAVALAGRISVVAGDGVPVLMTLTGRRSLPGGFSVV